MGETLPVMVSTVQAFKGKEDGEVWAQHRALESFNNSLALPWGFLFGFFLQFFTHNQREKVTFDVKSWAAKLTRGREELSEHRLPRIWGADVIAGSSYLH